MYNSRYLAVSAMATCSMIGALSYNTGYSMTEA